MKVQSITRRIGFLAASFMLAAAAAQAASSEFITIDRNVTFTL